MASTLLEREIPVFRAPFVFFRSNPSGGITLIGFAALDPFRLRYEHHFPAIAVLAAFQQLKKVLASTSRIVEMDGTKAGIGLELGTQKQKLGS